MAENTTLARPYAWAVFELAQAAKKLQPWSETLDFAAAVAIDPQVARLIGNPRTTKAKLIELFTAVCKLDAQGVNLIKVLVENRRLGVLPEIAEIYAQLRAEAERTVIAEVVTAFALDAAQEKSLVATLKQKLNREVSLQSRVDPELMGGAIIRVGDRVIDGSLSGRLNQLANELARR
ncbi:MAG: F0F1 ATP synthase subunit delta [Pseudomonadota bacterium]